MPNSFRLTEAHNLQGFCVWYSINLILILCHNCLSCCPRNCYHGTSPYTQGLTGLGTWKSGFANGFGIHHVSTPKNFPFFPTFNLFLRSFNIFSGFYLFFFLLFPASVFVFVLVAHIFTCVHIIIHMLLPPSH